MANHTSRLSIVINTRNAEQDINRLRQLLAGLHTSGQNAGNGINHLGGTINNTTNNVNHFGGAVNNTSNNINNFNRNINNTTNNFTRMGNVVNNNTVIINQAANAANRASNAFANLKSVFGGLVGIGTAISIAKTADEMQNLNSQIHLVTNSQDQFLAVQERLKAMTDKNLASIDSTIGLYTNSARALQNMGKSQEDVLKFTNAISLAMSVGGKSAQEQSSALLQLGQAMQSGVLQGDEFRSIAENAPVLLDLVAQSLHKTRGEVKELASDGEITAEVLFNAVNNATGQLQKQFDSMPVTMAQAFTVAKNHYKEFVDDMMNGTGGISQTIASMILGVSKNFDNLAKVGIAVAGVAMLQFANNVLFTAGTFSKLTALMKANPIFLIASVIIGASVATRGFDATMQDLGDTISVIGIVIGDLINFFGDLANTAYTVFAGIVDNANGSADGSSQAFGGFFADTGTGFQGFLVGTAKVFDAIAALIRATAVTGGQYMGKMVIGIQNLWVTMSNNVKSIFAGVVNYVVDAVNGAISSINSLIQSANSVSIFGQSANISTIGTIDHVTPTMGLTTANLDVSFAQNFDIEAQVQRSSGLERYARNAYAAVQANKELTTSQADLNSEMIKGSGAAYKAAQAKKALEEQEKSSGRAKKKSHTGSVDASALVQAAMQDIGVSEQNSPGTIMAYQKSIGYNINKIDAWCASFVGAKLKQAGFKSTNSPSAESYENYGVAYDKNKIIPAGAIGTIARKGGSGRHVFIIEKDNGDGTVSTIDGNWGHKVSHTTHKKSDIITVRIPVTIDGKVANKTVKSRPLDIKNDRQLQVFEAWKKAGLSAQQAKIMTAEVGREGEYLDKNLFGFHKDHNNGSINAGMLSWQKSRGKELIKYLQDAGLFKNGAIVKSQETLDAMAAFAVKEMLSGNYKKTKSQFITDKNIDAQKAFEIEGREYVGWDIDGKYGMSAKQVADAKAKRDKYFRQISAKTEAVGDVDLIKDWQEAQKQEEDIEQKRLALQKEYGSKQQQLAIDLKEKIAKIKEAQLPQEQKTHYIIQAMADNKRELDEYKKGLNDKLSALTQYKDSAISIINKTRDDALFDAEKEFKDDPVMLAKAQEAIQEKWRYDIAQHDIAIKKETQSLYAFKATERQAIIDKWDTEIAEAQSKTDELADIRVQALTEQKQKELDNYQLTQDEKLAGLFEYNKTALDLINSRYDIEARKIAQSNDENKDLLLANNEGKRWGEIGEKQKSANDDYLSTYFELYGDSENYNAYKGIEDKRIAQTNAVQNALDAGIIMHEEYYKTLKDIDDQYIANKQAVLVGGYQSIFGTMADALKAFGGEHRLAYRVLANAEKGYALYKAFLNNKTAILDAYATTPGAWYMKAAAAAKVAIQTGVMAKAISAITPQGFKTGGYTGNYGVNDVAGVVHGQEYVLNAQATKRIGVNNLNAMNKGESIGGNNVTNVVIENHTGSSVQQTTDKDGNVRVIVGQELKRQLADPYSDMHSGLQQNYHLQRRFG